MQYIENAVCHIENVSVFAFFHKIFALFYNKCHINCQNGFFCTKRTLVIQLNSNFAESNFAFSVKIYGYKNFCF